MQVEVTTDNAVDGGSELISEVEAEVGAALSRFSERLTRVEVHLGDENADKHGAADKRCTLEARPAGQPPVAVTHHAETLAQARAGALKKLRSLLEKRFGRADDRKGRESIRHDDGG